MGEAIGVLSASVRIPEVVQEPALALLVRHCNRQRAFPRQAKRLKRLVGACVLAASARQGMGLTIHEVAARTNLPVGEVKRQVWKVCKLNGIRLVRSQENVEAMLQRLCNSLRLGEQRAAVCDAAKQLVLIAEEAWITTGRMWAFVVCAALLLALKAYHYIVDAETLGSVIGVGPSSINIRVAELKRILVSLLQTLR